MSTLPLALAVAMLAASGAPQPAGPAISPAAKASAAKAPAAAASASAQLQDVDGKPIGRATLLQTPAGVLINVDAKGIAAGAHAFHIHAVGRCDGAEGFSSAGGHFALDRQHGFRVEGGPHPGDMPNVRVTDNGVFAVEVLNTQVSLEPDGEGYLLDADGAALVIHAGADDYHSQPAGDAGDRIACGVIEPVAGD